MVVDGFLQYDLFDQIYALAAKTEFETDDYASLEFTDERITEVIVKADKQCRRLNQAPWSIELHQAYLIHRYWVLWLSKL